MKTRGKRKWLSSALAAAAAMFALAGTAAADVAHYVYSNDDQDPNTVTVFAEAGDGSLTNLGQVLTGGSGCGGGFYASRRAGISRNGDILAAANSCSGTVSIFTGASTGSLVLLTQIPFETSLSGISVTSKGKCLVLGSGATGDVNSYLFPGLTKVNAVALGTSVADMKIATPGSQHYVAAALLFINEVAVIPFSPNNCVLGTPTDIATSGAGLPTGLDFSPDQTILYVGDANFSDTIVEAFTFPAGTPLTGSPYSYGSPPAGANSNTVLVSKDGDCLFAANQYSSSVTAIPLSEGVPGASATAFPAGSGFGAPAGMANDANGKWFYVASGFDNTVTTGVIGSGCALSEAPGTPIGTGAGGILLSLTTYP